MKRKYSKLAEFTFLCALVLFTAVLESCGPSSRTIRRSGPSYDSTEAQSNVDPKSVDGSVQNQDTAFSFDAKDRQKLAQLLRAYRFQHEGISDTASLLKKGDSAYWSLRVKYDASMGLDTLGLNQFQVDCGQNEQFVKLSKFGNEAFYHCVESLLRKDRYDDAMYWLNRAKKSDLSASEYWKVSLQQALTLYQMGKAEQAKKLWKDLGEQAEKEKSYQQELAFLNTLAEVRENYPDANLRRKLKRVLDRYLGRANYLELSKLVLEILPELNNQDIKVQLKIMMQSIWDKEEGIIRSAEAKKSNANVMDSLTRLYPGHDTPAPGDDSQVLVSDSSPSETLANISSPSANSDQRWKDIDSLYARGESLKALALLQSANLSQADNNFHKWYKKLGDRYCEEHRSAAADSYQKFKKNTKVTEQKTWLLDSQNHLDSCIQYFPQHPLSTKAAKNRDIVSQELTKLNK